MCVKCDGTGRLYTRVMSGAWLVTSCGCEDAEKVRQEEEIKMREWRKRLVEACELPILEFLEKARILFEAWNSKNRKITLYTKTTLGRRFEDILSLNGAKVS